MVDAEKRLLANALKDPDNQHFVLLSDRSVALSRYISIKGGEMGGSMGGVRHQKG